MRPVQAMSMRRRSPLYWNMIFISLVVWSGCDWSDNRRATADAQQPVSVAGEPLSLFDPRPIGEGFQSPPKISHVQIVDLDRDGLPDVVVCDCEKNQVSWLRQQSSGDYQEIVLQADVVAPAHAECVDFDGDGDLDVLIAVLGMLFPNNEPIGSLIALENLGPKTSGELEFESRVLLEKVARISDVRSGDFNSDGLLDLAVTHFGYNQGELRWMQNLGDWKFESHILQSLSGGIHGVVHDMNGDGALDISVLVSQEHEAIYLFAGDNQGNFKEEKIYAANNEEYGSSGLWVEDLDQDGDSDFLFTNGDAYDYSPPHPWPWHGVQWLENRGSDGFVYQRLAALGGAVCAVPADFDRDGDLDIFVSSTFNAWESPASQSLIVLENRGNMQFVQHDLANTPSHIQSVAAGDMNGDGRLDLISGGMHVSEPYDRVERILLWEGK